MRLIDADAFDRFIASHEFSAAMNEAYDEDRPFEATPMYYTAQSFRDVMKYRPTIDAAPVVHAKWIKADPLDEWSDYDCSNCGAFGYAMGTTPYCENCGAKMDAE